MMMCVELWLNFVMIHMIASCFLIAVRGPSSTPVHVQDSLCVMVNVSGDVSAELMLSAMDDTSYHPVSMTVNGVTKNVLIPLPKSRPGGQPITAKLPDGSSIVIDTNESAAGTVADNILTVASSSTTPSASTLLALAGKQRGSLSGSGPAKRTILAVQPGSSVYRLLPARPTVVTARPKPLPKFQVLTSSGTVAVESPSAHRRIVRLLPPPPAKCIRLPMPISKPALLPRGSVGPTRPIILRKNKPPVSRSVRTVVVRPSIRSPAPAAAAVTESSCCPTSTLTVVSSPRTLSHREAIAAGWFTDNNEDLGTTTDDSARPPVYPIRHIVPMDTNVSDEHSSDTNDNSQHELELTCNDIEPDLPNDDDRIVVDDNETQMKVIEILPNDADTAVSDNDEESDLKPAVPIKSEHAGNDLLDEDISRQCSSVSTETALSDAELSSREDFVVLAEWTPDELVTSGSGITHKTAATVTERRNKRRKRRFTKSRWKPKKSSAALTVYKARRSGGRPKTAEERHGIVDSFVSLPVMRLTTPSVNVRNAWRFLCCYKNQIQRCRCGSVPQEAQELAVTGDVSKIREFVDTLGLIQPSMMASGPTTLPVQLSGPTSVDGVTPLVVRQPDGKLASVVAKRTSPGGTTLDANKKKYLLVKTKTGSFLVPVNSLADASPAALTPLTTATPPTPPSPAKDVKPAVMSDPSGHRERIQELKERLRQQEEQLQSIRSQLSSSAVQKFDLDSVRY